MADNKSLIANEKAWQHAINANKDRFDDADRESFDWGWELGIEYALSILRRELPEFFLHMQDSDWCEP